jgi:hypothetical protein
VNKSVAWPPSNAYLPAEFLAPVSQALLFSPTPHSWLGGIALRIVSRAVSEFVRQQKGGWMEFLPACTPGLNSFGYLWSWRKHFELLDFCSAKLHSFADRWRACKLPKAAVFSPFYFDEQQRGTWRTE